jgi:hypothetical protein
LPGVYYVFIRDPRQKSGDYVAVVGKKEIWRFQDMIRALRNTPLIRLDQELHVGCSEPQTEDWRNWVRQLAEICLLPVP